MGLKVQERQKAEGGEQPRLPGSCFYRTSFERSFLVEKSWPWVVVFFKVLSRTSNTLKMKSNQFWGIYYMVNDKKKENQTVCLHYT